MNTQTVTIPDTPVAEYALLISDKQRKLLILALAEAVISNSFTGDDAAESALMLDTLGDLQSTGRTDLRE